MIFEKISTILNLRFDIQPTLHYLGSLEFKSPVATNVSVRNFTVKVSVRYMCYGLQIGGQHLGCDLPSTTLAQNNGATIWSVELRWATRLCFWCEMSTANALKQDAARYKF